MGAPQLAKLKLAVLVLASGRGERFKASGGTTHKLDALIHIGQGLPSITVLQATLDKACSTGLAVHVERASHTGMGETIAAAVAATRDFDGWLMLPADMPMVSPEVILTVAAGLQDTPIAVPVFKGKRGHPVGFSRDCLADLLALSGDEGARSLFQKFEVKKINVDDLPLAAGCLMDIDTVQDLENMQNSGIFS